MFSKLKKTPSPTTSEQMPPPTTLVHSPIADKNTSFESVPLQFKMALEAPSPTCPFPDEVRPSSSPFKFNVESPSSRRQSACAIMRADSSDSSSESDEEPEQSFLAVGSDALTKRRHSDNSIQMSKVLSSASSSFTNLSNRMGDRPSTPGSRRGSGHLTPLPSISRARSSSYLMNAGTRRRHSCVDPHDISRFATKLMDSAAESMVESVEKASKVSSCHSLSFIFETKSTECSCSRR